jgi:serine/threonine protein kinase
VPGDTLDERYRIVGLLGRGGMGEVYRADDLKLGQPVALKFLPQGLEQDESRLNRFISELRTARQVTHHNVCRVFDIEEVDGHHYLTMEYVDGEDLSSLARRIGRLPKDKALEIAQQLCAGVQAAHAQGILHRDLKPANVMIDGRGHVKITDFGLAGFESAIEGWEIRSGTPNYMAPEQQAGQEVTVRSDVYALGLLLYELFTGKAAFQADTPAEMARLHRESVPSNPSSHVEGFDPDIEQVILSCLEKDPRSRPESALAVSEALPGPVPAMDRTYTSSPTSGREDSRGSSIPAPRRRIGRFVLAVIGIAAIVAVALAIANWLQPPHQTITYTTHQITSAIGFEGDLNWSPESEFMALGRVRSGSYDVVVQPVAGGEAVVRAEGPGDQTAPRWSPDGKYLAYVSSAEPGTYIYLVPPHGGTPRKLIATNIATLDIEKATYAMGDRPWSPDSRSLVVSVVDETGRAAIRRVDRDNEDAEQLTFPPPGSEDLGPTYSFDGERIAFQRRTQGKGVLLTIPAAGGEPDVLLEDDSDNVMPTWRPDNHHLVFRRANPSSRVANVWELDTRTGSMRQLTFDTRDVMGVSVSADDRIAIVPFWHDTFLFTVDVAGGERRQLTSYTKDNFGARFSPDGRSIAYHSTRGGNAEIYLHHLDGSPETRITDDPGWDLYPDWSPDGSQLIFNSNRYDEKFKILVANSDGGGERLLVDQPVSVSSPWAPVNAVLVSRWSPNGEQVAYLATGPESSDLWTIQPNGENARERIKNVEGFDWYRDGRHGILCRPRRQWRIVLPRTRSHGDGAGRAVARAPGRS